jgi:hypothetical protein
MNPDHHGEAVCRLVAVRHVNVEVQAVFAPDNSRPDTVFELSAPATELGRLEETSEARRWQWRQPSRISYRRRGIGYAEVFGFSRPPGLSMGLGPLRSRGRRTQVATSQYSQVIILAIRSFKDFSPLTPLGDLLRVHRTQFILLHRTAAGVDAARQRGCFRLAVLQSLWFPPGRSCQPVSDHGSDPAQIVLCA